MNNIEEYFEDYIHKSRYARYNAMAQRRETWDESVTRLMQFWDKKGHLSIEEYEELHAAILNKEVMPSMRAMMTAGEALERDHIAAYNCAYGAVDSTNMFDELMYILMNGTGVGFSVERQYISQLPVVAHKFYDTDTTIIVEDSKKGWAKAVKEFIGMLYIGQIPKWDVSQVRAAGEPLKIFGGRASGPEPLVKLFKNLVAVFRKANGRKLNSLECHDVCCHIADAVVVGGVRRSALISLSNLSDQRMSKAKSGDWWHTDGQRALANNSVCYTEKPDVSSFMAEFLSLYQSHSGERGIFSRLAAQKKVASIGRREADHDFGTNPCSEIILRNRQFCNLTEVIVRPEDTLKNLKRKVRLATILGTLQSTLTDFKYISDRWKVNCDEERLLGVSLTGIFDNAKMSAPGSWLKCNLVDLKATAVATNKIWAKKLDIPQSTAITCVKPSGTVSQLCGTASGIHTRHSPYYIRRVRNDVLDPLAQHMIDAGVPHEVDVTNASAVIFSFPMEAPKGSTTRKDITAIQHLELWKEYAEHWCEHKPSITVSVREDEWPGVQAWVWEHMDIMSGVSFMPYADDDSVYEQAPYEEITEEQYNILKTEFENSIQDTVSEMITKELSVLELADNTTSSQELACSAGGSCEVF